jgi:hypothetical protein
VRRATLWRRAVRSVATLCAAAGVLVSARVAHADDTEPPKNPEAAPAQLSREFGLSDLAPRLTFHGFADITANVYFDKVEGAGNSSHNYFALGELDLFLVSHLADNVSFLSEIVFESNTDSEMAVELERIFIKYTVSDRFWISIGRHHTALGYWNEAYNHGLLLQPTVARPDVLNWEEHGGILPVHSVGLAMGGRVFRGPWGFEYAANVGNGRGLTSQDVQTMFDLNDQKALTLRLTASHEAKGRLLLGPMIHLDRIPADPAVPGREGEMKERIAGAYVTYRDDRFELLSEYYYVRHEDLLTGATYDSPGYFLIGVLSFGKLKPYGGYDRLDVDPADPYYGPEITPLKRSLLGLRWDLNSFNAIKFELRHDSRPGVQSNGLVVQTAFIF